MRYRSPAYYEDQLLVEVWVERLRAASLTFCYEITRLDDGKPTSLATAEIELACMDMTTRKPKIFSQELRRAFEGS